MRSISGPARGWITLNDSVPSKKTRMKLAKILMAVFIILVATACTALASQQQRDGASIQAGSEPKQVVLEVSTITCTGCWSRVEASARSVATVIDVKFDKYRIQRVTIMYDAAQTNSDTIIIAIERNGDKVIEISQ